jgi:hypothetical protein
LSSRGLINKVSKKQNEIVKTLHNRNEGRKKHNITYKDLGILKLDDIIELELSKLMHKVKLQALPNSVQQLFEIPELNEATRHYNLRNVGIPRIKTHKTRIYNQSFLVKSHTMWTNLPQTVKNSQTIGKFKIEFKKHKTQWY